ncbi:hypothetical protein Anas_12153 [Armadillidium nasatum]|uniref:Uncharacterized protein n=1 Tax=Armadillidium nasatum TaxID=96803 RepID=A0A5N5T7N2_9CRUS|nr:hypothetical protein Anas_12153 [Armadillidium nasatum]
MFKKLMYFCVDVELPQEMMNQMKICAKAEAQKTSILEDILDGNFPDKQEWANIFKSLEMCKMNSMGINDIDNDLTAEKFPELLMFDKWTGNEQVKEELKQNIISCFESAEGSGFEKLLSLNMCAMEYYLSQCQKKDEDPGMLLLFHLKLLTLFEDSKCAPVKVSDEMKQIVDDCIEESKEVLRNIPQSTSPPPNKNTPPEMAKFGIQGLQQCMGNKTGTYDFNTNFVNMTAIADSLKKFEGWEGLEQERDAVSQAIIECGREYEDSRERENDSEDEKLRDLMEDNKEFDNCFAPQFAKICGYNNIII